MEPIDLFLHGPSGLEMAHWPARNAVSGPIHVNYHLAEETPVGKWRLSASTRSRKSSNRGKTNQLRLEVVKYEPVGFEARLWMPTSSVPMDNGLAGWIEANRIGDGVPIFGSLRIEAKFTSSMKGENEGLYVRLGHA